MHNPALSAPATDALVAGWMRSLQDHPALAMLLVLSVLLICAFMLDAFEWIFLVVPMVMPPLLGLVGDAAWVAALTLLVLQAGFLLPPLGYALVLSRAQVAPTLPMAALVRPLVPYLACVLLVAAVVMAFPQTTHWLRSAPVLLPQSSMDADEVDRLMREMSQVPADDTPTPAE
ncbi:MAG: TRAP transporter large permease subunit [Burkholderiaceae bacterium]